MRILQVFGFFWQLIVFITAQNSYSVAQKCKNLEDTTLQLTTRLKKRLLCNYDSSVQPNYLKNVTVVMLRLLPKFMELEHDYTMSLHSWITLSWSDPHLTWTPSDYEGVDFIHIKSWEIWTPDLCVFNSGDMSDNELELPTTECLLHNEGFVSCVPSVKFIVRCDRDFTYFPYEKFQCRITFGSRAHPAMEVDYQLDRSGINMDDYENNKVWDFKFINAVKEINKHPLYPNDTFSTIDYNFLLARYYNASHTVTAVPAIALIFLTLTVFCLDSKSVERVALAGANLICHIICYYNVHWQLPYNGTDIPKIFIFYGNSIALATFAIVLTAFLRKLEDMNMEVPNWISSTTMFVLSNRASRFLILKDNEIKMADDDTVTEGDSNVPKSETKMKESSWRYFATIIDWLSFICVILTYVVTLIICVPIG